MILIILAIIAGVIGITLIDDNSSTRVMNEYCNLECRERKLKKYKFCC